MSKEPWFKFWASDYLTDPDVDRLPLEGQAVLLRMWCACWIHGDLPDDAEEIARLTQCQTQWVTQWLTHCRNFFVLRDGRLISARMEREKARSQGGREAAQRRWNQHPAVVPNGLPNGLPNAKPNAQKARKPESQKKDQKKDQKQTPVASATFVLPEFIDKVAWDGYCEMRKVEKKKMTDHARDLIIADLESFHAQGIDTTAVLNESTKRNWTGVFPPKANGGVKPVLKAPAPGQSFAERNSQ